MEAVVLLGGGWLGFSPYTSTAGICIVTEMDALFIPAVPLDSTHEYQ